MAEPSKSLRSLLDALRHIQVLRFPRHRLATFGSTEISYQLVTSVSEVPVMAKVRTGRVTAEKPQILTPAAYAERFKGFGEDSAAYERFLRDNFTESFRGLAYNFRNNLESTEPRHQDAREIAKNIRKDLDARDVGRGTVILAPEATWGFALMKFILEETSQSFAVNLRELEERGLFNPEAPEDRRRREVEAFFRRAETDPTLVKPLAELLNRHSLFNEYQDRFFQLVKRAS